MKTFLLVNPPIYDFAAYDLWAKPLGLLHLSSMLKAYGAKVQLLDYMDRYFGKSAKYSVSKYGCGSYNKQEILKPKIFSNIPRKFSRYGISRLEADIFLKSIEKPDAIIVTSIMTYWYPGVIEAIDAVKKQFPGVPVILGGVYATLCFDHALKNSNADFVITGSLNNLSGVFSKLNLISNFHWDFMDTPVPDYSFYHNNRYVVLKMSQGCPFKCSYCAQNILCDDKYMCRSSNDIIKEIIFFYSQGIKNIAFYDDALLYNSKLIKTVLSTLIKEKITVFIHTPNGLHSKYLDTELAELMYKSKFIMPRFSLETNNALRQALTGGKITNKVFEETVMCLNKAGYQKGEYIVYLLMGMPGQSFDEVEESIYFAHKLGAKISLSEYSVIPETKDFQLVDKKFEEEPLLHNNSAYPLFSKSEINKIYEVKTLAVKLNSLL